MRSRMKDRLAEAFLELCCEKAIKKITVSDIVKKADTGRQSFYNHFRDKFELINWIFEKRSTEIITGFRPEDGWHRIIANYYHSFLDQKAFYSQAAKLEGQNSFADYLYRETFAFHRETIMRRAGGELTGDMLFAVRFNTLAAIGICTEWMKNGMEETPDEMARLLTSCLPLPIREYLLDNRGHVKDRSSAPS